MALSWSWTPAGLPRRLTGGQVWAGTLWRGGVGWGGGAEGAEGGRIQTPEDVHHKGRGSRYPAGPGRTELDEQHSRTAGNMPPDPVANQRPRPFCPRGGRTRVTPPPRCGGRDAEIRGQVVVLHLKPLPPELSYQVGAQNWRGNGLQITHLIGFICNPEGQGLRLECSLLD